MTDNQHSELRIRGGSTILGYLKKFSATEKAVFGIFAVLLIGSAVAMAASVNDAFMVDVPANGGTLHEGLVGLPHTVNPVLAVTDADRDISALVYAGLTKYENGAIVPDLASSWTVSPDGRTYTFSLRPGLTFQDGSPLTADDVVFTVQKIQDAALKSPRAADWAGVTASSTSPTTVVFALKQPYSAFLANTTVGIIPKKIWGGVSDDQFIYSQYNQEPIGAGPYDIASVSRDQGGIPTDYTLAAWNSYHAGAPHISDIVFTFFPDLDHAVSALENGSIDSLPSVPPAVAEELATNAGEPYKVEAAPITRVFGVFLNPNKNSVLADPSVRKALAMSVDRSALIDGVLSGYGIPMTNVIPPGAVPYGTTTTSASASAAASNASTTGPDIAGAQAVLEKAGWKKGSDGIYAKAATRRTPAETLSFTLYTADTPDLKQAADMLRQEWAAVGADVAVKTYDPNELYQDVIQTRDYDALLFGEAMGHATDLYAFWHSSQRTSPGLNVAMYANSTADRILESLRLATSTEDRASLYGSLSGVISQDNPAIFLYAPELTYVVPKQLNGIDLGVVSSPADRFADVGNWYIETDRVWKAFAGTRAQ